jgi:hypothetical protein
VTQYQKVTLAEIERRNYTERTMRAYLRARDDLAGGLCEYRTPARSRPSRIS